MDQPQLFTDSRYLFMHRIELVEAGVHQQPGWQLAAGTAQQRRPPSNKCGVGDHDVPFPLYT
jgi:hypothetical protein